MIGLLVAVLKPWGAGEPPPTRSLARSHHRSSLPLERPERSARHGERRHPEGRSRREPHRACPGTPSTPPFADTRRGASGQSSSTARGRTRPSVSVRASLRPGSPSPGRRHRLVRPGRSGGRGDRRARRDVPAGAHATGRPDLAGDRTTVSTGSTSSQSTRSLGWRVPVRADRGRPPAVSRGARARTGSTCSSTGRSGASGSRSRTGSPTSPTRRSAEPARPRSLCSIRSRRARTSRSASSRRLTASPSPLPASEGPPLDEAGAWLGCRSRHGSATQIVRRERVPAAGDEARGHAGATVGGHVGDARAPRAGAAVRDGCGHRPHARRRARRAPASCSGRPTGTAWTPGVYRLDGHLGGLRWPARGELARRAAPGSGSELPPLLAAARGWARYAGTSGVILGTAEPLGTGSDARRRSGEMQFAAGDGRLSGVDRRRVRRHRDRREPRDPRLRVPAGPWRTRVDARIERPFLRRDDQVLMTANRASGRPAAPARTSPRRRPGSSTGTLARCAWDVQLDASAWPHACRRHPS